MDEMALITRRALEQIDIDAFSLDFSRCTKGCTLRNRDGRLAYITLEDALSSTWRVFNYSNDLLIRLYASVEEVIDDGWRINRARR